MEGYLYDLINYDNSEILDNLSNELNIIEEGLISSVYP